MRFITFALSCCVWWNAATQSHRILIGLGEPNSPDINNAKNITDEWFEQKLDHFNPVDNRTWKQRYQINKEYYKEGGPIFLMIGGEGEISALWMTNGAWIDYAKEFNALCFQLEHRFYGKSHPTDDMSSENLIYLSSEQALADLAQFIVDIKIQYKISASAKWIAFGGSYPGSLAAWLRMKYPHLIYAAVSSSGPLLAKLDFYEYFKVVEDALSNYKPDCVIQIKNANQMLNKLVKSDKSTSYINKKFKLCDPLDISKKKDVSNLFETLAGNFAEVVQYNKDNRLSATTERLELTLETLCDIMTDESKDSPLDRYAAVNNKLLSVNNLSCTDYTYDNLIRNLRNVSWDCEAAAGGRQWTYQTCTEFGFYQTSNQEEHIFGNKFPIDFFVDMCSDIYGKKYNAELLSKGIEMTNIMYGELNIKESRVVYVHGSIDPWHALGITKAKFPNTAAIYINGTAHCANMYPPASTDLPQLTKARITIRAFINEWLTTSDSLELTESDNIHFY